MQKLTRLTVLFTGLLLSMPLLLSSAYAAGQTEKGLIQIKSSHSVTVTAARFEQAVQAKGLKVFPRFDHGQAAQQYGQALPANIVISFGNPRYGSPLMQQNPVAGIDFPPKAIVYSDAEGQVWLAYNSAEYLYETIFTRHGLAFTEQEKLGFAKVLQGFADFAVAPIK